MGSLFATPHMYSKTFNVSKSPTSPEGAGNTSIQTQLNLVDQASSKASTISSDNITSEVISERGYQKITEVYSEYKAKGLISPDFPEWTMAQLMNNLLTFEQSIADRYTKADVEPLTNIRVYKETLGNYFNEIYGGKSSWFNVYMNPNPIILKGTNQEVYIFKQEFIDNLLKKGEGTSRLSGYTQSFNTLLSENKTLGLNGKTPIKNSITYNMFIIDIDVESVDLLKTLQEQTGITSPTNEDLANLKRYIENILRPVQETTKGTQQNPSKVSKINEPLYIFDGVDRFDRTISQIETEANKKLSEYETAISADLARKINLKLRCESRIFHVEIR
jgi:hypothetical protein